MRYLRGNLPENLQKQKAGYISLVVGTKELKNLYVQGQPLGIVIK